MASHSQNGSGNLEDSVRQMLISSGPSRTSGLFENGPEPGSHPAVRLPPSTSYGPPPNVSSNVVPPHLRNQQRQQLPHPSHQGNSYYQNGGQPYGQSPGPQGRGQRMQQPYGPRGNNHQQYGYNATPRQNMPSPVPQQRARNQQQMQLDPNAFHRGNFNQPQAPRGGRSHHLFNPHQPRGPMPNHHDQQHTLQSQYLEYMADKQISKIDMPPAEFEEKEALRSKLDTVVRTICAERADRLPKTSLQAFGSFKSGFATTGSDMDLVIVVEDQSSAAACFSLLEDDLPRVLEKKLLEMGYGARLLTRTRVPIIKVCEKPGSELLENLRKEREKWDLMSEEEKYPHLYPEKPDEVEPGMAESPVESTVSKNKEAGTPKRARKANSASPAATQSTTSSAQDPPNPEATPLPNGAAKPPPRRNDDKPWTREKKAGPLDFPSTGVGIHSDVNFFNPLGLHNTQLLRCYSLCDSRVRPIILFVKAWAKARKINSSYSGTLSSYGYVLMVLHYLVNVTRPPVLPNLQNDFDPFGNLLPEGQEVDSWPVRFWRDEPAITAAAARGQITQNQESIGALLAGFFHYYSSLIIGGRTFHWMQSVVSLRSPGGILTKEEKGWVRAVTEEGEGKKIQHRYLFCIEDPFELDHNVARTVTHRGIVAVRDEFRRAHRILVGVGFGRGGVGEEFCAELVEAVEVKAGVGGAQQGQMQGQNGTSGTPAGQTKHPKEHSELDTRDQTAFPSLAASPKVPLGKKKGPLPQAGQDEGNGEFSEISGDKAKVFLDEVRRKRDEAAAESTARFAAESVLEGFD